MKSTCHVFESLFSSFTNNDPLPPKKKRERERETETETDRENHQAK